MLSTVVSNIDKTDVTLMHKDCKDYTRYAEWCKFSNHSA